MKKNLFNYLLMGLLTLGIASPGLSKEIGLKELIQEAMGKNPELLAIKAKILAYTAKAPQARALPDPMVMFGYQNEGYKEYSYSTMEGSKWMFSLSQTFPFPGKLSLKGKMAETETENLRIYYEAVKLKIASKVKEFYLDLFLIDKNLVLTEEKISLLSKIEESVIARSASGVAKSQAEAIAVQTEKYMLLEKQEMLKQKKEALLSLLNNAMGRSEDFISIKAEEPEIKLFSYTLEELYKKAAQKSPELKAFEKMVAFSQFKLDLANKEYYPDFTFTLNLDKKKDSSKDMWGFAVAFNIPLFFSSKQNSGVDEAKAMINQSVYELGASKTMLNAGIRENYSMFKSAEKLMELYKNILIPKIRQDYEVSLSGFITGKMEVSIVMAKVKNMLDYDYFYWAQVVEREKALARLNALVGLEDENEKK